MWINAQQASVPVRESAKKAGIIQDCLKWAAAGLFDSRVYTRTVVVVDVVVVVVVVLVVVVCKCGEMCNKQVCLLESSKREQG